MAEANVSNPMALLKLNDPETVILDLPTEILVKIFSLLSQEHILNNVARVCKRFLAITRSPMVLPIIRMTGHFNWTMEKEYLSTKIQNCLKFYPQSKFDIEVRIPIPPYSPTNYSNVKHLLQVSDSIKYMWARFCIGNSKGVLFKNLEYLALQATYSHSSSHFGVYSDQLHTSAFWNNFPNLTYLLFNVQTEFCLVSLLDLHAKQPKLYSDSI